MKKELLVIKIGGDTLNDENRLKACLQACANANQPIILVHGGGKKVTELAGRLGIETKMVDGRRITSPETMDLCTMVYSGLISKQIVAQFYAFGKKAAGISGADFNAIISSKRQHPTIDFGMVGDVEKVDDAIFTFLINQKVIPVVSSVTLSENAELLNTNADTMAAEITKAMAKEFNAKLIFCFEKVGVLTDVNDENSLLKTISASTFEEMKKTRQIADGMIPKLQNAFEVLNAGGNEVRIMNSTSLSDYLAGEQPGTQMIL